ncbi:MAG TPA: hypothetical protein VFT67_15645 [Jatrophihabitantaceae bacterium]|nr:hypothetical protein [Jatrophihabitantaceae bacterium]
MRSRVPLRRAVVFLAAIVAIPAATSCSGALCNLPAIPTPSVMLSTVHWQRAHPTARITACINSHCHRIPVHGSPTQVVRPAEVANADTFTFSVRASVDGQQVLDTSIRTRLGDTHVQLGHGCGGYDIWQRNVRLTSAGRLALTTQPRP